LILACYKLAKFYCRHPNEFLNEPISAIVRHVAMTNKLLEQLAPPEE
jgi:hypothetical protein